MQMQCGAGNSGRAYCNLCPSLDLWRGPVIQLPGGIIVKCESTLDVSIGHLRRLINCHCIIIIVVTNAATVFISTNQSANKISF